MHVDFKKKFPFTFAHLRGNEIDNNKIQLWPYKKNYASNFLFTSTSSLYMNNLILCIILKRM
jgi:hypothetical protein